MMMKKTHLRLYLCLLMGIVASLSVYGQSVYARKISLPDCGLKNMYEIAPGIYRSDQPSSADFKAMEKYGIREVLNLRNRHSDVKEAAGTHIRLYRVKMKAHAINEEELIRALRIINNRKGPIVIHCHHGSDRTGAVVAMYRIVFQNVSPETAIKEMTEGGFGFHRIYKNIVRTIRNADVESIKSKVLSNS